MQLVAKIVADGLGKNVAKSLLFRSALFLNRLVASLRLKVGRRCSNLCKQKRRILPGLNWY